MRHRCPVHGAHRTNAIQLDWPKIICVFITKVFLFFFYFYLFCCILKLFFLCYENFPFANFRNFQMKQFSLFATKFQSYGAQHPTLFFFKKSWNFIIFFMDFSLCFCYVGKYWCVLYIKYGWRALFLLALPSLCIEFDDVDDKEHRSFSFCCVLAFRKVLCLGASICFACTRRAKHRFLYKNFIKCVNRKKLSVHIAFCLCVCYVFLFIGNQLIFIQFAVTLLDKTAASALRLANE